MLLEWLASEGIEAVSAREPGGTPVGEAIREILLDRRELGVPAETELLLMLAARAAFVREMVEPALAAGRLMVADRFELSTLAYQGVGRGLGVERARELNAFATGGLRPDLTLVFDLPVTEGRARRHAGGKVDDRIEGAGDAFLERVREGYLALAAADDGVEVVDAAPDADAVHQQVRTLVRSHFPELFRLARG